ncbi:MAG: response regulator [Cyclobacteriaceae bacterium]
MEESRLICSVDDEDVFHWIVRGNLKRVEKPCELLSFYNGDEILEYLLDSSNSRPDVLLLDINMPVCDGWKFLEGFTKLNKEQKGSIQIYIVTSSIDPKDQFRADQHPDVQAFISKPITVDFLEGVLSSIPV